MAEINGVFIDNVFAEQIPRIQKDVLKKDKDKIIVIDGKEGSGKSQLAMTLCKALDPTFNIDRIAFNHEQFIKLITDKNRKKGDAILLDEAFSSTSARASMTRINRAMMSIATEMRFLNLFIMICLPSFFDLDKYFALWRCDTLLHTYFNKKGNRGQYIIFTAKKKKYLYLKGKKYYNYSAVKSPYLPCKFIKKWVIDEIEYRKRKAEAFRDRPSQNERFVEKWKSRTIMLVEELHSKCGYSHTDIAKIFGLTKQSLSLLLNPQQTPLSRQAESK